MVYLKQYALQRSGSNLIKALLEINFKDVLVMADALGHKHEEASWARIQNSHRRQEPEVFGISDSEWGSIGGAVQDRKIGFLINVKEPFSWLVSYHRYAYGKMRFRNPEAVLPFDRAFVDRALDNWFRLVRSWQEFAVSEHEKCVWIPYERLLSNPEEVIANIQQQHGLSPNSEPLLTRLQQSTKRGTDAQRGNDLLQSGKVFDPEYYLKERWKETYSKQLLKHVAQRIGHTLYHDAALSQTFAFLGYECERFPSVTIPSSGSQEKAGVLDGRILSKTHVLCESGCLLKDHSNSLIRKVRGNGIVAKESESFGILYELTDTKVYHSAIELKQPIVANAISFRLRLSGWDKLEYLAIGTTGENKRFLHLKIKHLGQQSWLEDAFSSEDLSWKVQHPDSEECFRMWGDVRFFIKGEPGADGALLELDRVGLHEFQHDEILIQEDGILDNHPISPQSLQLIRNASHQLEKFSILAKDYFRRCFRSYKQQAAKHLADGSMPVAGDKNLDWCIRDRIPAAIASSPTFRYSWHALHPVAILLSSNDDSESSQLAHLKKVALTWVSLWMEHSYFGKEEDLKYLWYDHGVAERQLVLLMMMGSLLGEENVDLRLLGRMLIVIHEQAVLLASSSFYANHQPSKYHNHAWFQDIALLATAASCPFFAASRHWIKVAKERLSDQVDHLIVEDSGYSVFIENSIGYHHGIERLMKLACQLLDLVQVETNFLRAPMVGMARFSALMKYPDGRSASTGDTFRIPNAKAKAARKSLAGFPQFAVLPKAGYGVVRGLHDGIPYVFTLMASSLCSTHKHEDHLSFSLYFDGVEWLIDPSFFSHEYAKPIPSYLRSAAAHSGLWIPDRECSIDHQLTNLKGLCDISGSWTISGLTQAYRNLIFSRIIRGSMTRLRLNFDDSLQNVGTKENIHGWLLLQCGEGVSIEATQDSCVLAHPASNHRILVTWKGEVGFGSRELPEFGINTGVVGHGFMEKARIEVLQCPFVSSTNTLWEISVI